MVGKIHHFLPALLEVIREQVWCHGVGSAAEVVYLMLNLAVDMQQFDQLVSESISSLLLHWKGISLINNLSFVTIGVLEMPDRASTLVVS